MRENTSFMNTQDNKTYFYLCRFITKDNKQSSSIFLGPINIGQQAVAKKIWEDALQYFGNNPPPDNLRDIKIRILPSKKTEVDDDENDYLLLRAQQIYHRIHIIYQGCIKERKVCVHGCGHCKYLIPYN